MPEHYDVVAMQVPIVYNGLAEHDPDGMLFTLAAYEPMVEWLREEWERDDEVLRRLHDRLVWAGVVADGLQRYQRMVDRLQTLVGAGVRARLLGYLGGPDAVTIRTEPHDRWRNPVEAATRQNLQMTVDEVVGALHRLTGGTIDRLDPDAAVRDAWRAEWNAALEPMTKVLDDELTGVHERFTARRPGFEHASFRAGHVERMLFNDRADPDAHGPFDRCNPLRPVPVLQPLVLRGTVGDHVTVTVENRIRGREVGLHLQGLLGDLNEYDGADVGSNRSTLVRYHRRGGPHPGVDPDGTATRRVFLWDCTHEGAWPISDLGDVRSSERGTNLHGLFGVLLVEPAGSTWRDPETGRLLNGTGLIAQHVDVELPGAVPDDYVELQTPDGPCTHREFTVFIHDEPEIHSPLHLVEGPELHGIMPLSYRAEPMPNRIPHRMRELARHTDPANPGGDGIDHSAVAIALDDELGEVFLIGRDREAAPTPPGRSQVTDHQGPFLEKVSGEEQHHSSWLFGDPVTPIFRSYTGDPARIRVVHGGPKETHVFHLHVHQWRAVLPDTGPPSVNGIDDARHGSQLLDSITIGPQTTVTIDPLYGTGSRQHAVGDIIWHCHLYPHFHHGMWGLWRSFDRLVDGSVPYPDGSPCAPLRPLPGRAPRSGDRLGFPWFVGTDAPGVFPRKSPPPPAANDFQTGGRRRLLRMPAHSQPELDAMPLGCRTGRQPGAVFVDLDRGAADWNHAAGIGAKSPRIVHYEIEVDTARIEYNSHGWHDPRGHHYRLTKVAVTAPGAAEPKEFPVPAQEIEPFFPRANHGDVVELTFVNKLREMGPDGFDLRAHAVECGLHVHLVKFDVLASDGSATGFNYLSGASCASAVTGVVAPAGAIATNVSLHRWVVDEEFGPCFFHDHLLANFRQKRGLFAALIAEPHDSRWLLQDQKTTAWASPEAVVDAPALPAAGRTWFREACLAVADFVPLRDARIRDLNPPGLLGGVDDPGVMAVNYKNSPMTFRGDDPSQWFSEAAGSIDTPVITTYAGERLRIRLIQGSHEEQHGFVAHGLRWHREWHDPGSPLVDHQTIGISEAFTLDLNAGPDTALEPGDHLWWFASLDDTWLGCWGLVRVLPPGSSGPPELPEIARHRYPLPDRPVVRDGRWVTYADSSRVEATVREYVVRARRVEHHYDTTTLTDPWGLVYEVVDPGDVVIDGRGYARTAADQASGANLEPLVLRARAGEWVCVTLINELLPRAGTDPATLPTVPAEGEEQAGVAPDEDGGRAEPDPDDDPFLPPFGPEPAAPRVPVEHHDEFGHPDRRWVSPRVSLHAGLVRYDVVDSDGSWVGRNHDSTVASLGGPVAHAGHEGGEGNGRIKFREGHAYRHAETNVREYWWFADEAVAPPGSTGRVCLLRDMADVRNHNHHGLIGALVVEPADAEPASWTGVSTDVVHGGRTVREHVVFLQDGLRLFLHGNPAYPIPDAEIDGDPEDVGQKGINYRARFVHHSTMLDVEPATPVLSSSADQEVWLRMVCPSDKPRQHTFTVHGVVWPFAPWLAGRPQVPPADPSTTKGPVHHVPYTGSLSGITSGTTHDLVFTPEHPGDHAYRSSSFRWHVEQGMWGVLRVE